jgi:hypothetical protein
MDLKKNISDFKFHVALEAIKNENVEHIAEKYGIHENMVTRWKKLLIAEGARLYEKSKL